VGKGAGRGEAATAAVPTIIAGAVGTAYCSRNGCNTPLPTLHHPMLAAYCVFGKSITGFAAKKLNGRIWKWCHIVGITGPILHPRHVVETKRVPTTKSVFSIGRLAAVHTAFGLSCLLKRVCSLTRNKLQSTAKYQSFIRCRSGKARWATGLAQLRQTGGGLYCTTHS
jgi:hypothetical protein